MQFIAIIICIGGVLAYALSENGKIQRIGEICFGVGLFFVLWQWVGR